MREINLPSHPRVSGKFYVSKVHKIDDRVRIFPLKIYYRRYLFLGNIIVIFAVTHYSLED